MNRRTDLGQVDKNDITKRVLRMVSDANGCDAVFVDANPFMGGGELTIVWNSAHVVFLACRPLGQCQLGLF